MRIFRLFIGFVLLTAEVGVLAIALWMAFDGHDLQKPLGALWYEISPFSLTQSQFLIQNYISGGLWDKAIVPYLLLCPAWEAFLRILVPVFLLIIFAFWPRKKVRRFRPFR